MNQSGTLPKPPVFDHNSDRIQEMLYRFMESQMLFSAVELDVFTLIAQGQANKHNTAQAVSQTLGADFRAVTIFLDGLVGIGLLTKQADQYQLPDDVAQYLVKGQPDYLGGMVQHSKRLSENWSLLTDVVRQGYPAGGAQSLVEVEANFAELAKGLYVSNYPAAQLLAEQLKLPSQAKILDIAGGSGVWSIALAEKFSQTRVTLLDYPPVVALAKTYLERHRLSERYDFIAFDLETVPYPSQQYDLVLAGHICHAIGPDATQTMIQKAAQALKPGGQMVIIDFVPDEARSQTGWPLLFGVNMLVCTLSGNVFTTAQYHDWLKSAGLTPEDSIELERGVLALLGKKAQ